MKKSKVFMLVSIITLIVTIIASIGTYAWYVWSTSDDDKTKIVTNVGAATIYFDGGSSITGATIRPVSDKSKGIVKDVQVKTNVTNGLTFNLYLDINSIDPDLQHESFRYAIYKGSTLKKEGNFSSTYLDSNTVDCNVNTGVKHIELLTGESVTTSLTTYKLYIWIDGANYTNPTSMAGKSFSFNLHASGEDAIIQEGLIPDITQTIYGTLAYDLISTYNNSVKTEKLNGGVRYYLDTTHGLMSDIAGNLRFYGPSDLVNNYIYFNCDNYSNQNASTCELWRIIGVFDGKVKIIRNESIGELSWDQDKNQDSSLTTYSNNWETSSLQLFLNGLYYNRGEEESYTYLYWNTGTTSTILDLTDIGITNETRTNNLISESIWYLGGGTSSVLYSNEIYNNERTNKVGTTITNGNSFTITENIGLMYASDYGYATDFTKCSEKLNAYDSSTDSYACRTNNWLFNSSNNQWVITPYSGFSNSNARHVSASGNVSNNAVYRAFGVRPVLYLNSSVVNIGGDGTHDDPYTIKIKEKKRLLIDHIRNEYTNDTPTLITQSGSNDTYYYSYQDESNTWGLMNDGLTIDNTQDATTTGLAKVVTDTTKLTSGTEGNIRYFGPSDKVNNYIYFNCSDYSNQSSSTCELWRIIGIVDGKVKIIRNESISRLAWDQDRNQASNLRTYSNNWETSSLQLLLNGLYYNRGTTESHTYYSDKDGTTLTTLDLKTIGITEATRANNLISKSTWYLGGKSSSAVLYPNDIYNYERQNIVGTTIYNTNPFTINANIGLMYASDYGYGTDLTKCNKFIYDYSNNSQCIANNWLSNSNNNQWLITSRSSVSDDVWSVLYSGDVSPAHDVTDAYDLVYPVLYLNSQLDINSVGDGSSTNPYRISVS